MRLNDLSTAIVDAAIKVHRAFGPGLYESVYQLALVHELRRRGLLRNFGAALMKDGISRIAVGADVGAEPLRLCVRLKEYRHG